MLNVGLIGAGYWGKNHLKSLVKLQEQNLINELIVCDTRASILRQVEKHYEVKTTTSWEELVQSGKVDCVSIVTPTPFHYPMTKEFLNAGKDVLVEKPMAENTQQCDELITIARDNKAGLMAGHLFRYHPAVLELRKRVMRGEFGDVIYMTIKRQSIRVPRPDIGVLLALGIHEVDLSGFILGNRKPHQIFCDLISYFDGHEEMSLIIQKFGDLSSYSIESWIDPTQGKVRELTLIGSQGSAIINFSIPDRLKLVQSYITTGNDYNGKNHNEKFTVVNEGEFTVRLEYKEPLYEELLHFITQSETPSKTYLTDGIVGRNAVRMIELAFQSFKEKKFITVDGELI